MSDCKDITPNLCGGSMIPTYLACGSSSIKPYVKCNSLVLEMADCIDVPEPALGLTIELDYDGTDLGDDVRVTFVATNEGNVPLTNITMSSEKTGDTWTSEFLDAGESLTQYSSYCLTEADILYGELTISASAEGMYDDETVVTANASETLALSAAVISLETEFSAEAPPEHFYTLEAGDSFDMDVYIRNTGNVTVYGVAEIIKSSDGTIIDTSQWGDFEPGREVYHSYTYTVTAEDIDRKYIRLSLDAEGSNVYGDAVGAATIVRTFTLRS